MDITAAVRQYASRAWYLKLNLALLIKVIRSETINYIYYKYHMGYILGSNRDPEGID